MKLPESLVEGACFAAAVDHGPVVYPIQGLRLFHPLESLLCPAHTTPCFGKVCFARRLNLVLSSFFCLGSFSH